MGDKENTLKPAAGKRVLLLTPETYETIRQLLGAARLVPDPTEFEVIERGGKKNFRSRRSEDFGRPPGGAGGAVCTAFKLSLSDVDKFTVSTSTVAGLTPSGFTGGLKEFTVTDADGFVFAKLIVDSGGVPVSATVEQGTSIPSDTGTDFHRQIGTFHVEGTGEEAVLSVAQTRCGPFDATICRNWFAAEAPFYGVTWS